MKCDFPNLHIFPTVQKTPWDREKCEEAAPLVSLQLILLHKKYPLSRKQGQMVRREVL